MMAQAGLEAMKAQAGLEAMRPSGTQIHGLTIDSHTDYTLYLSTRSHLDSPAVSWPCNGHCTGHGRWGGYRVPTRVHIRPQWVNIRLYLAIIRLYLAINELYLAIMSSIWAIMNSNLAIMSSRLAMRL